MRLNTNGEDLFGGHFQSYLSNVDVTGARVASVTFSGLDGDTDRVYAMRVIWNNPLALTKRLDLRINGDALPASAYMIRQQWERSLGVREDRTDPDFTIADLVGAVADTFAEAAVYLGCTRVSIPYGFTCEVRGFCRDAAILANDRERVFHRLGVWGDTSANITSLTIQTGDASAAIDLNSSFWLFRK